MGLKSGQKEFLRRTFERLCDTAVWLEGDPSLKLRPAVIDVKS